MEGNWRCTTVVNGAVSKLVESNRELLIIKNEVAGRDKLKTN